MKILSKRKYNEMMSLIQDYQREISNDNFQIDFLKSELNFYEKTIEKIVGDLKDVQNQLKQTISKDKIRKNISKIIKKAGGK